MIEIVNKKSTRTYVNVWFPEEDYVTSQKCDVACYIGIPKLHSQKNQYIKFNSLLSDLTIPRDELVNKIHRSTKKEIRRSEKDNFEFKFFSSDEILEDSTVLNQFVEMYIKNYELKGLPTHNPTEEILRAAKQNGIIITAIYSETVPMAFGVYVTDNKNIRTWMSTSSFRMFNDNDSRRKVGRAKKRLLYESLLHFKDIGMQTYDWGGISSIDNPNGIDSLKMSFGGVPITYYDETIIMSLKYKVFNYIKKCIRK